MISKYKRERERERERDGEVFGVESLGFSLKESLNINVQFLGEFVKSFFLLNF